MASLIDQLMGTLWGTVRYPLDSFIALESSDDQQTLIANDGSLVSIVRVFGTRQVIGDTEYQRIVEQATLKLGAKFDRPGFALQVYFMRDPDRITHEIKRYMRPNWAAAKAIGLELEDLLSERARHLSNYLVWEGFYFVLWTRPNVLSKAEVDKAFKERAERKWVVAPNGMFPLGALDRLRVRHRSYVGSVTQSLEEIGIQARVMEVHDALSAVRTSIYPSVVNDQWRASLPGDKVTPRAPSDVGDYSDILWPPLRQQLCQADAECLTPTVARVGDRIWAACDVTLAPMECMPFPVLLSRVMTTDMPFRISFLIESGGIEGAGMRKFFASILAFTNDTNKQIKGTLDALADLASNEPVVRLRISAATYAKIGEEKLLESRLANLTQALESWGYCQVSTTAGDPLEAVMSSALGIGVASTAPAAIAPFFDVMKLLPWQRASSPFEEGAVLFRTPDGRVWPYQMGSNLTTTWFDIIFAQPGAGKSVLMNALNLGTCLSSGSGGLPFIAVLDIGPSSSGLISLIRDALPPDRQHEAQHFKLRMLPEYAINPFDTQLGCRHPLPEERAYLSELLTLLCTPPGQAQPYDGIPQLAGMCVDEMYRWRDDKMANAEPRPFLSNIDMQVDEAIAAYNIHLPPEPFWWDVVDALFKVGAIHQATLAQRQASPTLVDAVVAARRPQIRALLEETQIGASAEGVIHAFERMIASAIREFPILASVTRFDIGAARMCAIDLSEVAPQGDEVADRQTAIMYMLARYALVRSWWFGTESLKFMTEEYRPHHERRLRQIRETPKRICYDEFHRTARTKSVRSQLVRDVREGRKWGVQIVLASQLLEDFGDEMIDLATGVWICGATASDRAVNQTGDRFGLSETARWIMRNRLTGPRPSGAPVLLLLSTNEGRYEQHLINTLGPVELWALSTSAEDVEVRTRLYTQLGAERARKVLAMAYPNGSVRNELRRRVIARTEGGEVEQGATSAVISEIISELTQLALGLLHNAAE